MDNDKKVKVIKAGADNVTSCLFSELKEGDTVFVNGEKTLLSEDAHYSGDASYDGYLAYNEVFDGVFPEDCDAAED